MKAKDLMKQVIFPIAAAAILIVLFYPLCVDDGICDHLKLWTLVGIPFGVRRMFFWIIPRGFDIGGTIGVVALNLLVGGAIGGMVLIWGLVMAAFYLVKGIGLGFIWIVKKVAGR